LVISFSLPTWWAPPAQTMWQDGAVALLCCGISAYTQFVKTGVEGAAAASDLATFQTAVQQQYLGVFTGSLIADFGFNQNNTWVMSINMSGNRNSDFADARQQYLATLKGNAWITAKQALMASGNWDNADWDLYCHYCKLTALGATPQDIDDLIAYWQALPVPLQIPPSVATGVWSTYSRWITAPLFTVDALSQETESVMRAPVRTTLNRIGTLQEGWSVLFVAVNGAPGYKYYNGQAV
jgi:hypothetical protein